MLLADRGILAIRKEPSTVRFLGTVLGWRAGRSGRTETVVPLRPVPVLCGRTAGNMTWFTFRRSAVSYGPETTVLNGASVKPSSVTRGDVISALSDKELGELRKTSDSCDLNGDGFIDPARVPRSSDWAGREG